MNSEMLIVFGVLFVTVGLFATEWLRLELVALMALLALLLFGILTPEEALAGFSDSLVLIIAGLFVVGGGLFRTGVAAVLGDLLGKIAGRSQLRLTVVIMLVVGVLSAFISSTGTVAIFLPVVVTLAARAHLSPSKLLIPLSFASLLGGMLTLIGTPPNIVVSRELTAQGMEPFGFFSFTPIGLIMLILGVGFMVLIGSKMLPDRIKAERDEVGEPRPMTVHDLADHYGLIRQLMRLRVPASSSLVGKSTNGAQIRADYDVTIVELNVASDPFKEPREEVDPTVTFGAGDVLLVRGLAEDVAHLQTEHQLEDISAEPEALSSDIGVAEVLLPPRSRLVGKTLRESTFRDQYDLTVLSILRLGKPVKGNPSKVRLKFGDTLLIQGSWAEVRHLRSFKKDFILVTEPEQEPEEKPRLSRRAIVSIVIMLAMLVLMTTGLVPTVVAILLAAVAMVLFRCLTMEEAYGSMSWQSLLLIAAMLPMATALKKTGGMELVVTGLNASLGELGPLALMGGLFLLTSIFSQFISNTATTVLVAPIAFSAAVAMEVSPRTFLMTVAVAASTAFATPIASPVNTLVFTPGGYKFLDYTKVGLGMQLVLMVATLLFVPLLFPLGG